MSLLDKYWSNRLPEGHPYPSHCEQWDEYTCLRSDTDRMFFACGYCVEQSHFLLYTRPPGILRKLWRRTFLWKMRIFYLRRRLRLRWSNLSFERDVRLKFWVVHSICLGILLWVTFQSLILSARFALHSIDRKHPSSKSPKSSNLRTPTSKCQLLLQTSD